MKKGYKALKNTKKWIPCLNENSTNKKTFSRSKIIETATSFYKNLYSSQDNNQEENEPIIHDSTTLDRFSDSEIMKKIDRLKYDKSHGPDGIPNEAIKIGKFLLAPHLTNLFNKILNDRKIPTDWAKSDIILLYKKGDPANINNYRPISLQPNMYKLFASCLEERLAKYTEKHQPPEQAGFRKSFSTTDHIHTLEQIIEKYEEHQSPLYLAFIDYAKAFDSISHKSMWTALYECGVPCETIELIKDIYNKNVSYVKMETKGSEIKICRGVRQGDPLSPRIFITVLESIMKKLDWKQRGLNIKGVCLSNLRFADDIVLFSETAVQLEKMVCELLKVSQEIGLELNAKKTKIMTNSIKIPINVNTTQLEYVQDYIYLGKQIAFTKSRHYDEINRRINITWSKFWSYKEVLKSNLPIKLKKKVLDTCILPCLSYGSQTWIFNNNINNKLQVCQRAMERSILNIKRRDRKRNADIRKTTNIIDALEHCKQQKWRWAGHVARMSKQKWTYIVTTWPGPQHKRKRARPRQRWTDEINRVAGRDWMSKANDRVVWNKMEEAFTRREVLKS